MDTGSQSEQRDSHTAELERRIEELQQEAALYRSLVMRLEARDSVTRIVAESASLVEAAPRILRAICEFLSWQVGAFWLLDDSRSVPHLVSTWSAAGEFPRFIAASEQGQFPIGQGLVGRVWATQDAAWIPDIDRDPNFPRANAARLDGLHSGFAFPIVAQDRVIAVIEFFSRDNRPPDDTLLQMFVIIGHQIGLFIERRRAEEQLLRQARIAALRAEIAASLAHSGDLRAILSECTAALVKHLSVAFARIWTLNAADNVLELQSSAGLYTHIDGGHSRVPVGAFKIGWIAEKRQPHLTNSVSDDPRVTDRLWARREGMQAFAGYPLLVEDRLMGVMAMFSREKLEDPALDELTPIANAIAQFLDRRRAEDELRRSEALKTAMLDTALDAVVAMNHTGRIVEFNAAAEAMFGRARADVLGLPIADVIVPPRFRDAHRVGLARYLSTGESKVLGRRIDIAALRADGTEFPVELAIGRIAGEGPAMFTAYIRDLTPAS